MCQEKSCQQVKKQLEKEDSSFQLKKKKKRKQIRKKGFPTFAPLTGIYN